MWFPRQNKASSTSIFFSLVLKLLECGFQVSNDPLGENIGVEANEGDPNIAKLDGSRGNSGSVYCARERLAI